MNCSKCNCSNRVKSGKIKDRQRYKCKECGCNYTVEIKLTARPLSQEKQALHLYFEGLGFRFIGRYFGEDWIMIIKNAIRTTLHYMLTVATDRELRHKPAIMTELLKATNLFR